MSQLRLKNLALGELERDVLALLWEQGPMNPGAVHDQLHRGRKVSVNTIASALKRLCDKGLLARMKVSHAYVYRPRVTRSDLERQLIGAVADQFGDSAERGGGGGLLAAFVDLAEQQGEDTLRRLEALVAERLAATADAESKGENDTSRGPSR